HRAFLPQPVEVETEPGVVVGRRPDPLPRVGVYAPGGRAAYPSSVLMGGVPARVAGVGEGGVCSPPGPGGSPRDVGRGAAAPGGRAAYPSSVLMGVVPARVAGVGEVIVCSPPGPDGNPSDVVLAAAALGGADRLFAIGGAGAIAAMAYGTATIPRVDRIVGPGNAYVAEAKLQVSGVVAIDAPAGPSELLVIADGSADPALVAREMLAQAEHDPRAAVVAVVVGDETAAQLTEALSTQLPLMGRR